ncbi:HD domain-containing protein [Actinocorallia herbida]|uniref:HD domain-containing protein n=1 Tax=Actinocorallia herbida TaxID=58109 RepID=A0A3N1CPF9_9ACTN|nr:HD domain-containing phosphohydrolase [Actinocorallia herbida]ROO83182.1 HD domain-containing protein [Actinocorallia herbida]
MVAGSRLQATREKSAWQHLDSAQLVVMGAAAALVVAALAWLAANGGVDDLEPAIIFGVLIALGELFRMNMPGGREVAPISRAGALAYGMLLSVGGEPVVHSPFQVVAVTACGMAAGTLPHVAVNRSPKIDAMARRLVAAAVVAILFRPLTDVLFTGEPLTHREWLTALGLMTAISAAAALADMTVAALIRSEAVRARFGIAFVDEFRASALLCAASSATGMLIAVATSVMGLAALLLFTAPILTTQFAFRRYAAVRTTYLQTVRALSRVTEVGGYVEAEHSLRVSKLSVAMGRELGMAEAELLELEYAALMHDIGQLSLPDPIPGGATVLAAPEDQRRIADLGAGVIEQTGVLDMVARIVRAQCDPYRDPAGVRPGPPLASRIIKAANAYDDLMGDSRDRDRAAAVLDRLRADSAFQYDPAVVEALARVLDRRVLR